MKYGTMRKAPFVVVALIIFTQLVGTGIQTVSAEESIDLGGTWRFKGESKYHIEFVIKGAQLVATFVYDDAELKRDYGERLPFFTATLKGRKFDGRMDYYQSKGALVTGKIGNDSKTISFIDGSRSGESVLYRQ